MKKKVITISVISVLVVGILLGILIPVYLFIIKGDNSEFNPRFNPGIEGFVMDIGDASALGISKGSAISTSINASPDSAMSNALGHDDNRNYIVKKKDADSHLHKVKFKHKKTDEHGKHQGTYEDNTSEELEQEDISAEIDKLYVLGDYTFISFVRSGESNRPADADLEFDTDGIAIYDKCDYYTNDDRKSYIVDNDTGYIYAIVDFNIKKIQGGCLLSSNDNYIYDFKITDNDELEIFSLFTNDSITWVGCFKDKYGNTYIQNNKLNFYDETTHTYFYVFEPYSSWHNYVVSNNAHINYELTSTGEVIQVTYGNYYLTVTDAKIMLAEGATRDLTSSDTFDIYYDRNNADEYYFYMNILGNSYYTSWNKAIYSYFHNCVYKVKNGVVYGYNTYIDYGDILRYYTYDAVNDKIKWLDIQYMESNIFASTAYLEKYDIVLEYKDGKVYCYKNFSESFDSLPEDIYSYWYEKNISLISSCFSTEVVLDNCSLSDDHDSFLTYGVNGNTYYDIVVEEVDGNIEVNSYISGTYQKPQTKILLQPINK